MLLQQEHGSVWHTPPPFCPHIPQQLILLIICNILICLYKWHVLGSKKKKGEGCGRGGKGDGGEELWTEQGGGGDRRWEGGGGGGRMEHRGGWSEKVGGRRYDWGGRARTGWMDKLGGRQDCVDRQMGGPRGPKDRVHGRSDGLVGWAGQKDWAEGRTGREEGLGEREDWLDGPGRCKDWVDGPAGNTIGNSICN